MPDKKLKTITFVQAPGVSADERKALEAHWKVALADPDYTVITNYEVRVDVVKMKPDHTLMVIAPNIPFVEIKLLRKLIDKAKARRKGLVVTNYEICVDTVPIS